MNICFVMVSTVRSGGTRVLFEVADKLATRHSVSIVSLNRPLQDWFPFKNDVNFIFPERIVPTYKGMRPLREVWERVLKPYNLDFAHLLVNNIKNNTDIAIATWWGTAYAVNRCGAKKKIYYMQHYESLFYNDPYMQRMADETYFLPLRRIANSTWLKNKLAPRGLDSTVVYPAVDTLTFHPIDQPKHESLAIISLGKKTEWKGLTDLFKALELVSKKASVRLTLYGGEPELAKQSPVPCEYVVSPSDEKLCALYTASDVAVTPSWYESSPLPPLEAMACGCPVVTTCYGTEDYCFNGVNSLVVQPHDPITMAEAILKIATDKVFAENLAKKGLETARARTWDMVMNEVEVIFNETALV